MFPGDMEMNFDRFSAYPDPSAVDFNDPSFQYFNFPDFNDDVPAQSYVDPSAIVSTPLFLPLFLPPLPFSKLWINWKTERMIDQPLLVNRSFGYIPLPYYPDTQTNHKL